MHTRSMFRPLLVLSSLFLALNASALPIQYEFGYTFSSGETVTGRFTGVEDGGIFTNISDAWIEFGTSNFQVEELGGWDPLNWEWRADLTVLSLDPLASNIGFFGVDGVYGAWGFYIDSLSGDFPSVFFWDRSDDQNWIEHFDVSAADGDWYLRAVSASVPEAGRTAVFIFAALGGVALLKRRISGLQA